MNTKVNNSSSGYSARILGFETSKKQIFLNFLKKVFPQQPYLWDETNWTWKYLENPNNQNNETSFFAYLSDDEIIGCIGLFKVKLKIGDEEVPAAWDINLAVDSAHRNKGIATVLIAEAARHLRFCLALGGSDVTFRIFDKLGWRYIGNVPTFEFVLSAGVKLRSRTINFFKRISLYLFWKFISFLSRLKLNEKPGAILIEKIESFGPVFDELWERVGKQHMIAVRRDKEYLNWRFIQKPHSLYDIFLLKKSGAALGYLILRVIDEKDAKKGLIVDFLVPPGDTVLFSASVNYAVRWFKERNVDIISCVTSSAAFAGVLRKKLFIKKLYPGDKLAANITIQPTLIEKLSNWHITYADSDQDFS